ncbi:hypothetical protein GN956_G5402 [Arapaima gigas]
MKHGHGERGETADRRSGARTTHWPRRSPHSHYERGANHSAAGGEPHENVPPRLSGVEPGVGLSRRCRVRSDFKVSTSGRSYSIESFSHERSDRLSTDHI